MTPRAARPNAPDRTTCPAGQGTAHRRREGAARRIRRGVVVLGVTLAHAAVLTSLEAPRDPSGRGQAVVASAVIVRQVAMAVQPPDAAARRDAVPAAGPDAPPVVMLPSPAAISQQVGVSDAKPVPAQPDLPRRAPAARRPGAAATVAAANALSTSADAARLEPGATPAASPDVPPEPPKAANEPAVHAADTLEGEAGSSSTAEALLPEHLLRSLPTYAVRLPPSQHLRFRVSRGAVSGEGTLDWSLHDDGRYSAALRLRGEGLPGMDWTSEGDAAGEAGVLPRRMVAHRKGRPVAAANFALDEQKVTFSGARVERPFVRGGQDRLTWMLQLAGVLQARTQPLRDDERIVLYVVGPRGAADLWQWRVVGRETLGDGASAVPALKLVREAQRLYDTEVELWLDPSHHHLPLKWRQQQRGVERAPLEWERVPG